MKKVSCMTLVLILLTVLLAGCGGNADTGTASPPETGESGTAETAPPEADGDETDAPSPAEPVGEEITITVATWGDNSRKEMFDKVFAPLKEEKNINVEIQVYPAGEYSTKVLTQIASGSGPDVVWLTERYYPLFASEGVLADMNPLMADPEYKFEDFSESLVNQYIVDGNLMAMPFTANPLAWFYNASLFEEAGLPTPLELYNNGEWTVDKMMECAQAITDSAQGNYGLSLLLTNDPANWPVLLNYIWGMGGQFFDDATESCLINEPAGIQALQTFSDMMFVDEIHTKPGDQVSFESGKLGMYQDNPSAAANYQDVDFEWDYICAPTTDEGELINVVGVAMYGILNTSENYDAALEVVKYATGEQVMTDLIATFSSPRQSIKESDVFMQATASMPSPDARRILYVDVFNGTTKTYPATTNWADVDIKVKELMDRLYTNSYPLADITAEMETAVNALLKQQ